MDHSSLILPKTTDFLDFLNKSMYICGFLNFWVVPVKFPQKFTMFYDKIIKFNHFFLVIFMVSTYLSYFTQRPENLSFIQKNDRSSGLLSMPFVFFFYYILIYYKARVKRILYVLYIEVKEDYNDLKIEALMIKKNKIYLVAFVVLTGSNVISRGIISFIKSILFNVPFNPFVSVWPDVTDTSTLGFIVRVINYIAMCFYLIRAIGVFLLTGAMFIALFCQFKNLQSYFYKLDDIFYNENLTQDEKDRKYHDGFKKGIRMHSTTIWCVNECQYIYRPIFSGQMVFIFIHLISLMSHLVGSKDSLMPVLQEIPLFIAILVLLAYFMLNAGDITVEASLLPNAMFASGWQNCHSNTIATRKLLVNAIAMAQQPVVMKAFNIIELSYESFILIVKTSYSVFTVFY